MAAVAGSSNVPGEPDGLVRGRATSSVPITGPVRVARRSTVIVTFVSVRRSASETVSAIGSPTRVTTIAAVPSAPPAGVAVSAMSAGEPSVVSASG